MARSIERGRVLYARCMAKPTTTALKRFGHYLLLNRIDVTGVAEVHAAWALDGAPDDRLCELKVLRRELSGRKKSIALFLDEGHTLSRLSHPAIARLRDQGILGDRNYLALEYVAGETVASLAKLAAQSRAYIPLTVAVAICGQVARALDHAHGLRDRSGEATPIIHGALAPHCVRVSYRGAVKLLGFGNPLTAVHLSETSGGEPIELPRYEAPEQLLEHPLTAATDCYRLGVMLYRLTAGRDPYDEANRRRFSQAVISGQVVRPSSVVANYPPQLEAIVLRAIAREPRQRFASADELASALEQLLGLAPRDCCALTARWVSLVAGERQARHDALVRALSAGRSQGLVDASFASWHGEAEPMTPPVELAALQPVRPAAVDGPTVPNPTGFGDAAGFGDLPTKPLSTAELREISVRTTARGGGEFEFDLIPPAAGDFEEATTHPIPAEARAAAKIAEDPFAEPTGRFKRARPTR
jgi:eukaryotic-like serine/threonine-protein kinase